MDLDTLRARALYGIRQNVGYTVAIAAIESQSAGEAKYWNEFAAKARAAVENFAVSTTVPSGLPTSKHAFVVLGSGLAADGTMKKKLTRRMDLTFAAAKKYPNSKIIVSGGAPKSGWTEARRMRDWLVKEGIAPSRIIMEDKSASTVSNGRYSLLKLIENKLTTYTIISDASHLRRAALIFEAAKLRWQYTNKKPLAITMVKNYGFPDDTMTKVATTATRNTVFTFASYTAYLTGKYATAVANNEISYPTLKVGSKGAWVKALQTKLGIAADGTFGPKTKIAVAKAQKAKNLVADGVAGPKTLKTLGVASK